MVKSHARWLSPIFLGQVTLLGTLPAHSQMPEIPRACVKAIEAEMARSGIGDSLNKLPLGWLKTQSSTDEINSDLAKMDKETQVIDARIESLEQEIERLRQAEMRELTKLGLMERAARRDAAEKNRARAKEELDQFNARGELQKIENELGESQKLAESIATEIKTAEQFQQAIQEAMLKSTEKADAREFIDDGPKLLDQQRLQAAQKKIDDLKKQQIALQKKKKELADNLTRTEKILESAQKDLDSVQSRANSLPNPNTLATELVSLRNKRQTLHENMDRLSLARGSLGVTTLRLQSKPETSMTEAQELVDSWRRALAALDDPSTEMESRKRLLGEITAWLKARVNDQQNLPEDHLRAWQNLVKNLSRAPTTGTQTRLEAAKFIRTRLKQAEENLKRVQEEAKNPLSPVNYITRVRLDVYPKTSGEVAYEIVGLRGAALAKWQVEMDTTCQVKSLRILEGVNAEPKPQALIVNSQCTKDDPAWPIRCQDYGITEALKAAPVGPATTTNPAFPIGRGGKDGVR